MNLALGCILSDIQLISYIKIDHMLLRNGLLDYKEILFLRPSIEKLETEIRKCWIRQAMMVQLSTRLMKFCKYIHMAWEPNGKNSITLK